MVTQSDIPLSPQTLTPQLRSPGCRVYYTLESDTPPGIAKRSYTYAYTQKKVSIDHLAACFVRLFGPVYTYLFRANHCLTLAWELADSFFWNIIQFKALLMRANLLLTRFILHQSWVNDFCSSFFLRLFQVWIVFLALCWVF